MRLQRLLARGLQATACLWPPIVLAFLWVHRAAHILNNADGDPGAQVQCRYQVLLDEMGAQRALLGPLASAVDHFLKVTASYWPGLFHCYDVPGLPRTNNDLEQQFGSARYHTRRASGRKGADPGMVVRGSVRLVAALVTRHNTLSGADLQPHSLERWRSLRATLAYRHEARRAQCRFRRNPTAYLAALEAQLLTPTLPS
jgi:hypothetical protein